MMGLSDGRKIFRIGLAVLIQYRSVTDTQPASHPASHVSVSITLNAQASSLKSITSKSRGNGTDTTNHSKWTSYVVYRTVPFSISVNVFQHPEKELSRATISRTLHVSHTKLFENSTQTAQTSAKAAVT